VFVSVALSSILLVLMVFLRLNALCTPGACICSDIKLLHLDEDQEKNSNHFRAPSGQDYEIVSKQPVVEWLANNYKSFGAKLEFVTNRSQEGSQFCKGFGGIGGLLRYQVDFLTLEGADEVEDVLDDDFF